MSAVPVDPESSSSLPRRAVPALGSVNRASGKTEVKEFAAVLNLPRCHSRCWRYSRKQNIQKFLPSWSLCSGAGDCNQNISIIKCYVSRCYEEESRKEEIWGVRLWWDSWGDSLILGRMGWETGLEVTCELRLNGSGGAALGDSPDRERCKQMSLGLGI